MTSFACYETLWDTSGSDPFTALLEEEAAKRGDA